MLAPILSIVNSVVMFICSVAFAVVANRHNKHVQRLNDMFKSNGPAREHQRWINTGWADLELVKRRQLTMFWLAAAVFVMNFASLTLFVTATYAKVLTLVSVLVWGLYLVKRLWPRGQEELA